MENTKPTQRKSFAAVLLAALLVAALAGAALALASYFGVLDFLAPTGGALPPGTIQTAFTQDTCTVDDITVRIRDAASDGRMLYIAIEASVQTPDDAILITYDTYGIGDSEDARFWRAAYPDPSFMPDYEALASANAIHYLYPLNDLEIEGQGLRNGQSPVVGINWRYEGIQTVISNIIIDLRLLASPKEMLSVTVHANTAREVTLEEFEAEWGKLGGTPASTFVPLLPQTQKVITTEVQAGKMDIRIAHTEKPFTFAGNSIQGIEVAVSPLATYITCLSSEATTPFFILDAQGNEYKDLVLISLGLPYIGSNGTMLITQSDGVLPESVILHARESNAEDSIVRLIEDFVE